MSKTSTETPIKALFCYCMLAFGVALIAAQDRAQSQEKNDTKSSAKEQDKLTKPETKLSTSNNSKTATAQKKDSKSESTQTEKSTAEISTAEISTAEKGSLPVVHIKTEAADGNESMLKFQSDAFDVVPPEWYEQPVTTDKDNNVTSFHVIGFDEQQLKDEIETRLQSEIDRYVDQLLGSAAHHQVSFSEPEKKKLLTRSEVRAGIYFDGQKQTPVDFYFAQLEFDKSFQSLAKTKWVEKRQQSRLVQFGLIGGASLLLLGFVFGGLRLNSATSGFYQGRLQFFVAVVILGVIAAGVYFGTQIDWI